MSLLTRITAKKNRAPVAMPAECQHRDLAPRWDSVDDVGRVDKITHYACVGCGAMLLPEQVAARGTEHS
jgi:hypothetical protein